MPLTCSCPDYYDDAAWSFDPPSDYTQLARKRAVRCSSCTTLIPVGAICATFNRWRYPRNDIEDRIYGDGGEVPISPMFLCEQCADLYFSLDELGFECVAPCENMRELVQEYANLQREWAEEKAA